MKISKVVFLVIFFVALTFKGFSQNPILKGWADPGVKVWNGKIYLSVGRDSIIKEKRFSMSKWAIFSSTNMLDWKNETEILPSQTYVGSNYDQCFATDIGYFKGKYYFYFSDYVNSTGVLVANKPEGPYKDILKKPVLPPRIAPNNLSYDPTIFTDDDGLSYLIFGLDGFHQGSIWHYQIVKLNSDMISLAEAPRDLITGSEFGLGNSKLSPDHNYFHKKDGIYYLSCGAKYAKSKNIYGPFSDVKSAGLNYNHTAFVEYNSQDYHIYNSPVNSSATPYYRQINVTYLHYKNNGDLVDDMDFALGGRYFTNGVGSYSAKWDTIQAEWYFNKSTSAFKKESPNGGFEIQNLTNNSFLNFPNIKDLKGKATVNFNVSSEKGGGRIEVRKDSSSGTLLGTCNIPKSGSFTNYQITSCVLKNIAETTNLFFVFKGAKGELARLDWFNFSK